jgi:predicted nucleic acid-binding protein
VREYVIDTSVAVKWVVARGEPDVQAAQRLLLAFHRQDCVLTAPDLLFVEFANALAAGHRREIAEVKQAVSFLRDLDLKVAPFSWAALSRAAEIAVAAQSTVYDACFLAVAEHSGGTLVTADDRFLRRVGPHPNAVALRDLKLAG